MLNNKLTVQEIAYRTGVDIEVVRSFLNSKKELSKSYINCKGKYIQIF